MSAVLAGTEQDVGVVHDGLAARQMGGGEQGILGGARCGTCDKMSHRGHRDGDENGRHGKGGDLFDEGESALAKGLFHGRPCWTAGACVGSGRVRIFCTPKPMARVGGGDGSRR